MKSIRDILTVIGVALIIVGSVIGYFSSLSFFNFGMGGVSVALSLLGCACTLPCFVDDMKNEKKGC